MIHYLVDYGVPRKSTIEKKKPVDGVCEAQVKQSLNVSPSDKNQNNQTLDAVIGRQDGAKDSSGAGSLLFHLASFLWYSAVDYLSSKNKQDEKFDIFDSDDDYNF